MLINRLSGLVLPASSKYLIDDVLTKGRDRAADADRARHRRRDGGAGGDVVRAVAGPRHRRQAAITEMRRAVHEHITAPAGALLRQDAVAGVLISRVMSDAEGIRNLVGTGLVQLTGSIVTAVLLARRALLPELAPDADHAAHPRRFGGVMGYAFKSCARCSASAARSTPRSPAG
jgi:subfamily B ATP-binding cassette protein MsbA